MPSFVAGPKPIKSLYRAIKTMEDRFCELAKNGHVYKLRFCPWTLSRSGAMLSRMTCNKKRMHKHRESMPVLQSLHAFAGSNPAHRPCQSSAKAWHPKC